MSFLVSFFSSSNVIVLAFGDVRQGRRAGRQVLRDPLRALLCGHGQQRHGCLTARCFFGAVFSRLESFQDDMNADLLADGLGGGPGMSLSAVTSGGSSLLASGLAVFRVHSCRCCQRPWPPQPHDRCAGADLPDREWCRNSR